MTEMSPVSHRLSIRYLENFSGEGKNSAPGATAVATEPFQNGTTQPKSHAHSKEKVEQNELSNDASNETSDDDNAGANRRKPLTSRNLEAQNKEHNDVSESAMNDGVSSSITSPPTGEESTGKSGQSTEATSASTDSNSKNPLPKKFFCKVCNQGFTRKHNMVSHEMIHTTIKLHRCDNCNLLFRRIHDLKRHEKLHTGEKPFHCENCDRSFARPDALTRHLNSPHACSGTKDGEENSQHTQTSNTSSSSYQASKRRESAEAGNNSNRPHQLPQLAKTFNEEQLLPLGSESSSASLLPIGNKSDGDSGTNSSGAERPSLPGPLHNSSIGYYGGTSSFSGDSNDSNHSNRPNFEINRWRSQQHIPKGGQVSENIVRGIMQKQQTATGALIDDGKGVQPGKQTSQMPHGVHYPPRSGSVDLLPYNRPYSPYHRLNASLAALNKAVFHSPGIGRSPATEARSEMTDNAFAPSVSNHNNSPLDRTLAQNAPPSHLTHDPFLPLHPKPGQYYQNLPMVPQNTQAYSIESATRPYYPAVPNLEGWPGAPQMHHSHGPGKLRSGSSQAGWPEGHFMRLDDTDPKEPLNHSPEYVRAEAYHDLQNHANNLQVRVTSLEQRMELLEEKLKRENKNNAKFQKRQEKRAKKKNKKTSTK